MKWVWCVIFLLIAGLTLFDVVLPAMMGGEVDPFQAVYAGAVTIVWAMRTAWHEVTAS